MLRFVNWRLRSIDQHQALKTSSFRERLPPLAIIDDGPIARSQRFAHTQARRLLLVRRDQPAGLVSNQDAKGSPVQVTRWRSRDSRRNRR